MLRNGYYSGAKLVEAILRQTQRTHCCDFKIHLLGPGDPFTHIWSWINGFMLVTEFRTARLAGGSSPLSLRTVALIL